MEQIIQLNNRLPYNTKLKERTRDLRKNMPEPEKRLWYWFLRWLQKTVLLPPQVRGTEGEFSIWNKIENKFSKWNTFRIYKQRPIYNFIVDFYIPKLKLVIEIDWESHFDEQGKAYDKERTIILEWLWLKVIRFTNKEVMKNFDWVCEVLRKEFGRVRNSP